MAFLRPYFPEEKEGETLSRRWKITWRFPFTRGMEVYQANRSRCLARRDLPPCPRCFSSSLSHDDVLERERERERAKVAPGGGRPSRVMRVDRVEGATWEEAMPPLAPSDRSPTATPRLNCSSAIRLSKCHRELNFSLLPRTTFKSRFDKQIKWLVPWTTIIISLSDDDEIFL